MLGFFYNSLLNHRQEEQDILKAFKRVIKNNPLLAVSIKVHQNQWNKGVVFNCKDDKMEDLITDILRNIISEPSCLSAHHIPTPHYHDNNISITIAPQDHYYARICLHMRDKETGEFLANRINQAKLRKGLERLSRYVETPASLASKTAAKMP